jgi:SAM-dependent methyltransferase
MAHIRELTGILPQPLRFQLRRLAFAGSAVTCPLCGNSVREFRSHGGGAEVLDRRKVVGGMRRDNDRCPVCHGCDRTRMMKLYLETNTQITRSPMRLLHIAPDFGLYLWLKTLPKLEYTGSDIDPSRYRHVANMKPADLTSMPFADNQFDIVICSHVLEHVPDDKKAFAEIFRILAPGGHALLLTPQALDGNPTEEDPRINDPVEQDRRFGQWDHVRIYSRQDFLDRMKASGFDVEVFDAYASDRAQAEALHLNPLEILPVGRKKSV